MKKQDIVQNVFIWTVIHVKQWSMPIDDIIISQSAYL